MTSRIFWITAAILGLYAFAPNASAQKTADVSGLIEQLNDHDPEQRRKAAESLARIVDGKTIVPPVLARLKNETDWDVKLALSYAAACQGKKSHIEPLIESLGRTGHFGFIYLRHATGQDFGWNADFYRDWLNETTDQEYLDFVDERWKRKPMMDEFSEFASLFSKQSFASMTYVETGELVNPDDQLTREEKQRLKQLPTAKAWRLYSAAIEQLTEKGDRKEAARLFHQVADEYSETYYAKESNELANLLDKMLEEESVFEMPDNFESLPVDKRIAIHIHFLRNVRAYQVMQPGSCQIFFGGSNLPGEKNYNPAQALLEIGNPARAALDDLDGDRRPIRGYGFWRGFHPTRKILRYEDAATQILNRMR